MPPQGGSSSARPGARAVRDRPEDRPQIRPARDCAAAATGGGRGRTGRRRGGGATGARVAVGSVSPRAPKSGRRAHRPAESAGLLMTWWWCAKDFLAKELITLDRITSWISGPPFHGWRMRVRARFVPVTPPAPKYLHHFGSPDGATRGAGGPCAHYFVVTQLQINTRRALRLCADHSPRAVHPCPGLARSAAWSRGSPMSAPRGPAPAAPPAR